MTWPRQPDSFSESFIEDRILELPLEESDRVYLMPRKCEMEGLVFQAEEVGVTSNLLELKTKM